MNVDEPKENIQFDENVEIKVDEAKDENYVEMSAKEESERVTKVDNDDNNTLVTEMNGDNKAEAEQNTYEDVMWEDEEDPSEEDNEENVVEEDVVSLEETTEEEDYDDEDEVSEEEPTEEGDENNTQDNEEIGNEEGKEAEEHNAEKVEIGLKNITKSGERSRTKRVRAETLKKVSGDDNEYEVIEQGATKEEGYENNTQDNKEVAKENGREAEENNAGKVKISLTNIKKSSDRSRRKKVRAERSKKVDSRDKPESSRKRKVKKRVESMGMIFMCSSKTKNDCYQYRVFGLPESKKNIVKKIYTGMRLFLYDVDLKLMYGIYKAAGSGGYNIEPKAFKSQFPSQVRFTVLEDCLPLAEERFKKFIKENYFTKTKFDCQLNSEQVKKLCKLFVDSSKGHLPKKLGRRRKAEKHQPVRQERTIRRRPLEEKRLASREELRYHERPRKRQREVISPLAPTRQPLPASLPAPVPSTVPSYVHVRTSDTNAYRRDPYLESHSPYRDRRDPLLDRPDPYRDGRDPYLERHYSYRDGREPYIERHDPYRDARDPYPEHVDSYRDGRDSYLGRHDRDVRDPYIESRDPYRDRRDPYSELRATYRDGTHSELYSSYRRDPLSDRRLVSVEDRRVEYPSSYRREEVLERCDPHPSSLETRRRDDLVSRDSYISYRERPSYANPIYSAEYPSRAGLAREYRL
ncbi:hypothetical protein CDL12_02922 [Handroanthus impetiginosus]|uniref:DCD domain-containing protein n=1 Tax=Handroanthus impetiginosus TaxID=429701 RepID=A0A2G9I3R6_9LAMI|nr:hypothetical protein CDL12_02922 [Handroanthus impetiginosus]